MRFYKALSCALLMFISSGLYAKNYEYNGDCKSNDPNMDFELCLSKELENYDKDLNILYKQLIKGVSHDKFTKAEQLWIKFKEADCDYMAREVNEGKMYQFIYNICLINKTKARINDLKRSFFYSHWVDVRS